MNTLNEKTIENINYFRNMYETAYKNVPHTYGGMLYAACNDLVYSDDPTKVDTASEIFTSACVSFFKLGA